MNALAAGALLGVLGILIGAFGAHALKARLADRSEVFETGVRYHLAHAGVLVALGVWQRLAPTPPGLFGPAVWLLVVGVVLFSGSLYVLALWRVRALGPVTPLGGLFLAAGWFLVFLAALAR